MLAGGSQQLLPDEPSVSASSAEVVDVLEGVLNRPGCPQQCRDFALTALMKLSVRFADQAERIKVRLLCTSLYKRMLSASSWLQALCSGDG